MIEQVIKADGSYQDFNPKKINGWGEWAANHDAIADHVDWGSIVLDAVAESEPVVSSKDLHQSLIDQCVKRNDWYYQILAGRLYTARMVKEIHGYEYPTLNDQYHKLQFLGLTAPMGYTQDELAYLNGIIRHERNMDNPYFSLKTIREKYSICTFSSPRMIDKEYETPQFVYMRIAMAVYQDRGEDKLKMVTDMYNHLSEKRLSAPTPNYINFGTPHHGFISCCLVKSGDTIPSIVAGDMVAYRMSALSAGIGQYLETRSQGDGVRGNRISHQGKLPYIRHTATGVSANMQAGRGGSANVFYTAFDPEFTLLTHAKNPRTPSKRRERGVDYTVMKNKFMLRKAMNNEKVFSFNIHTAPDLVKAFFDPNGDESVFAEKYAEYERNPNFKKVYVDARDLVIDAGTQGYETGRVYSAMIDEINRHNAFKDPVYQSNLCVVGDTKILTKNGYVEIKSVVGTKQDVWNGEEWSTVDVVKTGEDQELVTVSFNGSPDITCTPYHKFYVQDGDTVVEKRASELQYRDAIIQFNLPTIDGDLDYHMNATDASMCYVIEGLEVEPPTTNHTAESRIDWINGLIAASGMINPPKMQISRSGMETWVKLQTNKDTENLYYMLQTVGLLLPLVKDTDNDLCIILGVDDFNFLSTYKPGDVQPRNMTLRVQDVENKGERGDTYCFTEHKRHMGMFNGILTGQCVEIVQPTEHYENEQGLFSEDPNTQGEVSMCAIAAIPTPNITSDEQYEDVAYHALQMIDYAILNNDYPYPHMMATAIARMNAGVGMIGTAESMAKAGLQYNTNEGRQYLMDMAERHAYFMVKASLRIGREKGNCEWSHKMKWADGWTFLDTYNRNVDTLVNDPTPKYDWETLRQEIIENGGIRNSALIAHMPSESSSKAVGCTNGVYPIRDLHKLKSDNVNVVEWVVPHNSTLATQYQRATDLSEEEQLMAYACIQKYTDQTISADRWKYIPEGVTVSTDSILSQERVMARYGVKTTYYVNTDTSSKDSCEGCSV